VLCFLKLYPNLQERSAGISLVGRHCWLVQQWLPKNPAHCGTSKLAVALEYGTAFVPSST